MSMLRMRRGGGLVSLPPSSAPHQSGSGAALPPVTCALRSIRLCRRPGRWGHGPRTGDAGPGTLRSYQLCILRVRVWDRLLIYSPSGDHKGTGRDTRVSAESPRVGAAGLRCATPTSVRGTGACKDWARLGRGELHGPWRDTPTRLMRGPRDWRVATRRAAARVPRHGRQARVSMHAQQRMQHQGRGCCCWRGAAAGLVDPGCILSSSVTAVCRYTSRPLLESCATTELLEAVTNGSLRPLRTAS